MSSQKANSNNSTPTAPLLRSLRAAILASPLAKGPEALTGKIRLHVVFSTPKSAKQLYPLAYVSPNKPPKNKDENKSELSPEQRRLQEIRRGIVKDGMVDAWEEQVFVTASWIPDPKPHPTSTSTSTSNQPASSSYGAPVPEQAAEPPSTAEEDQSESGPRMIYALESYLYTLPSDQSALLYVSKLDSTGFGPKPTRNFYRPGNEKIMEYLETIELEKERNLQEEDKKKKSEMVANLKNSSPGHKSTKSTDNSNILSKPTIARTGSFTGMKEGSPKAVKPISTAASSIYASSKSSLTNLITHAFLHHFCSLSHWSPPPNRHLSIDSAPPPLPRFSSGGSSSNTMPIKHLSLHILARSQATYLFPGSPENKGKRVLSDTGLIKWWKKCTEGVIRHIKLEAEENQKWQSDLFDDVRLREGSLNPIPALPRNSSASSLVSRSTSSASSAASSASPAASLSPVASGLRLPPEPTESERIKNKNANELKRSSNIIKESSSVPGILTNSSMDIRPFYLIPGYNRLESHPLVPINSSNDVEWVYGHPYSRDVENPPPLPLHLPSFSSSSARGNETVEEGKHFSIATLIPHFPDDPKSRFLDELARDAHEHAGNYDERRSEVKDEAPESKRVKLDETQDQSGESTKTEEPVSVSTTVANSASDSTNPSPAPTTSSNPSSRLTSQQKHLSRERQALDNVSADEFWERMGFRQECCSGNVVGAFVIGFTTRTVDPTSLHSPLHTHATASSSSHQKASSSATSTSPRPSPLSLPNPTLPDLILKHLLRDACDWSNLKSAIKLTLSWERGLKKAVLHRGGFSSSSFTSPSSQSITSGPNAGQEVSEEEKLKDVAKGILWADLDLNGPCEPEKLQEALEKWEKENEVEFREVMKSRENFEKNLDGNERSSGNVQGSSAGTNSSTNTGAAKVNSLSVKRKRKN